MSDHEEDDEVGKIADEAWKRASQTWEDWTVVGRWFVLARELSMREAHVNEPKGRGYNQAFARRLERREFRKMDQAARKRLFDCMKNAEAIEKWRNTLTLSERLKYNHPTTVWRKWEQKTKVPDPNAPKRPSQKEAIIALEEEIVDLKEENATLKRHEQDGTTVTPKDAVRDIVAMCVACLRTMPRIKQALKMLEDRLVEMRSGTPAKTKMKTVDGETQ